jgi:hypothetical protein
MLPLQVCDLIEGTMCRALEGEAQLNELVTALRALRYQGRGRLDGSNAPVDSIVKLF